MQFYNWGRTMTPFLRILYIIGAALSIGGSFLPWQREGDFVSDWTYGIRFHPSFKDNGGLLIILLSTAVFGLILHPPDFVKRPAIWSVVLGIILVIASGFHVVKWLIQRIEANGVVGAPALQVGLVMVLLGSLLLLLTALLHYSKETT